MHRPSTMLWRRGYCSTVAGWARLMARATESDFQYDRKAPPPARPKATMMPSGPHPMRRLNARQTSRTSRTKATIRTADRRLLAATWSYMPATTGYLGGGVGWAGDDAVKRGVRRSARRRHHR